jgi:hypothetical protein
MQTPRNNLQTTKNYEPNDSEFGDLYAAWLEGDANLDAISEGMLDEFEQIGLVHQYRLNTCLLARTQREAIRSGIVCGTCADEGETSCNCWRMWVTS